VKLVPYALGELAHWGQDLNEQPINRAYGQVGIRSSLPMWWSDNSIESNLWNVHGIAHKVVFDLDFSYANSTQDINQFPLYDQIDDDAINQYRRNIPYFDFGAVPFQGSFVPLQAPFIFGPDNKFDPRLYAIRRGMGSWVTGPTEIANDGGRRNGDPSAIDGSSTGSFSTSTASSSRSPTRTSGRPLASGSTTSAGMSATAPRSSPRPTSTSSPRASSSTRWGP